MKKIKKYEDFLFKSLQNPKEAAAYLNVHLEDSSKDKDQLFLLALRDVAKAYGFTELAHKSELGRESLYKALSENGNPKLVTLISVLDALGLKLSVEVNKKAS